MCFKTRGWRDCVSQSLDRTEISNEERAKRTKDRRRDFTSAFHNNRIWDTVRCCVFGRAEDIDGDGGVGDPESQRKP